MKLHAIVPLEGKTKSNDSVAIMVDVDDLSGQMSIMLDDRYFAHIRVDETLRMTVYFQKVGHQLLNIDLMDVLYEENAPGGCRDRAIQHLIDRYPDDFNKFFNREITLRQELLDVKRELKELKNG